MKNASIETKILIVILSILVVVSAGYAGTQLYIRDHNVQKTTVVSEESSEETTTESTTETAEESSTESTTIAESTVTELTSVEDTDNETATTATTNSSSSPLAFVYVSASGSKYHTADCSYAKNGTKISAEDAVAKGYEPCKVCNPQIDDLTTTAATVTVTSTTANTTENSGSTDSSIVYVSGSGKKYHSANCRYVSESSTKMSITDAVAKGYEPCKICNPDSGTAAETTVSTTNDVTTTKANTTTKSTTANSGSNDSSVVYVTGSGKKYHSASCRYVNESSTTMSVSDAVAKGYEPCKICSPDSGSDNGNTSATTSKSTTVKSDNNNSSVVYITGSGKKYHSASCRYVNESSTSMSVSDAISKGYESCKICNPGSGSETETTASSAKSTTDSTSNSSVVYVTASGKKYHQAGCRYVSDSSTKLSLKDAVAKGYEPCSICN